MWKSWKTTAAAAVVLLAYPTWHWLQLGDYLDFGLDVLGLGATGLSLARLAVSSKQAPAKVAPVETAKPAEQPIAVDKPATKASLPPVDPEASLYARCLESPEQFGIRYVHTDGVECAIVKRVTARLRREGFNVTGDCEENPIPGYEDLGILEIRKQEGQAPADAKAEEQPAVIGSAGTV